MPNTVVVDQIAAVYPLCGVSSSDAILNPGYGGATADDIVLGLMNEVYREVGRLCSLWRRSVEVSLTDDVAAYAYPADVTRILMEYGAVCIGTAKTPIGYIMRPDMAEWYPDYRSATKTTIPTYWYEQDSRAFALYPPPAVYQSETATAAGTITNSGNASVTVTAAALSGTPVTYSVPVVSGDTAATWAETVRTYLQGQTALTALYSVSGTDTTIVLTRLVAGSVDATLNIALADGTSTGVTTAASSSDTTSKLYLDAYVTPKAQASSVVGRVLPLAKAAGETAGSEATATPALPADYYDVLKYGTASKAIETYLPDDEKAQALYPNVRRQYERFIGLLLERTVLG
jgi:hypothetical protein